MRQIIKHYSYGKELAIKSALIHTHTHIYIICSALIMNLHIGEDTGHEPSLLKPSSLKIIMHKPIHAILFMHANLCSSFKINVQIIYIV